MTARDGDTAAAMIALLDRIAIVPDEPARERLVRRLGRPDQPTVVAFVNQHAFNLAWRDPDLREVLGAADLLLRDGVGLELCLRRLGRDPGCNLNGTDLIPAVLAGAPPSRVAVFGTAEPWLGRAAARIAAMGHDVVATLDGFQPDAAYLRLCAEHAPTIVVLGMGMPRQERLSRVLADGCAAPCLVLNGGAILDFLADRFPRAPAWIRAARLEWLFRLAREPRRLAGRYLAGGLLFAIRLRRLSRAARA